MDRHPLLDWHPRPSTTKADNRLQSVPTDNGSEHSFCRVPQRRLDARRPARTQSMRDVQHDWGGGGSAVDTWGHFPDPGL